MNGGDISNEDLHQSAAENYIQLSKTHAVLPAALVDNFLVN